jgi:hypothetical protein
MAWGRGDVKIDRGSVLVGLPLGPLLVVGGYAALLKSGAVISDLMLCLLLVWPTAVLVVVAAIAAICGRDVTRWISMEGLGPFVDDLVVSDLLFRGRAGPLPQFAARPVLLR